MAEDLPDYFFVDGASEQHGPVEPDELAEHWRNGLVNEMTLVFAADGSMPNWSPIEDVAPLHTKCTGAVARVAPAPPLPPPPPPAPPSPSPASGGGGGGGSDVHSVLLSGITGFAKGALKKTESIVSSGSSPAASPRDALLSGISGFDSTRLRKVDTRETAPTRQPMPRNSVLTAVLKRGKVARQSIVPNEDSDEDADEPPRGPAGLANLLANRGAKALPTHAESPGADAPAPAVSTGRFEQLKKTAPKLSSAPKKEAEAAEPLRSLVTWQTKTTAEGQTYCEGRATRTPSAIC